MMKMIIYEYIDRLIEDLLKNIVILLTYITHISESTGS